MTKLTGAKLLARIDDLDDISKIQIANACGYENILEFLEAVLSAKSGIELDTSTSNQAHVKTEFDFSRFDLADKDLVKCTKISGDLAELDLGAI